MPGDFRGGWLPTLDTSLKVTKNNKVTFKFYEKPVGAMRTIHRRTAMAENPKIQILANDIVRRFLNCSEDTPTGELRMIVDKDAQKIVNGGFSVEQARRIIVAGSKGYRGKLDRC